MKMLWYLPWSENIKKRACRYLLQRYLGNFLEEKLTLDQLSVDLYNGTGTVSEVSLDCEVNHCSLHLSSTYSYAFAPPETLKWKYSSINVVFCEVRANLLCVETTRACIKTKKRRRWKYALLLNKVFFASH